MLTGVENVKLPELNEIINQYSNLEVEQGQFYVYSEFYLENGQMDGCVKPVIENLQVVNWDEEQEDFLTKLWEAVAGIFAEALENQPKDRLATQVPISGSLQDAEVGILASIWNVFKNAFVEAFRKSIEVTIPEE